MLQTRPIIYSLNDFIIICYDSLKEKYKKKKKRIGFDMCVSKPIIFDNLSVCFLILIKTCRDVGANE